MLQILTSINCELTPIDTRLNTASLKKIISDKNQ